MRLHVAARGRLAFARQAQRRGAGRAQRQVGAGELPKVALVACMRKLLTTLNAMVRTRTVWQPDRASVAQA